jgi:hypothetical protein
MLVRLCPGPVIGCWQVLDFDVAALLHFAHGVGDGKAGGRYKIDSSASLGSTTVLQSVIERVSVSHPVRCT